MDMRIEISEKRKQLPQDESNLGFGQIFTDHMFIMEYDSGAGWHSARIVPYQKFSMDPASIVLHYGQSIFEGAKAYRKPDGNIQLFRIKDNFARMKNSAKRLCMPEFDIEFVTDALLKLIQVDQHWVPSAEGTSLYIRPTMIGDDPFLGVRAANHYTFYIILSPSGAYYPTGQTPQNIYVEDQYVRAVRGGLGFTKASANYAASILAGDIAKHKGYAQVLWLDGIEQKYLEEVGSMNIMVRFGNVLATPELNGSILAGITRDSILRLAADMGIEVSQCRISVQQLIDGIKSGTVSEVFGTGTAAVISPVGKVAYQGVDYTVGDGSTGEYSKKLYEILTGIQYGRIPDPYGWTQNV